MLKHTKPICHHSKCFIFFIFIFSTNKGRFLSKFTCRNLVNCFLQFKSKKPGFSCKDTRRLAPRKTTSQLGTPLIDTQIRQINPSLSCSRQPVTWPQCVHIISGAVRLGWPDSNPQKFDSFTGETTVQWLFYSSLQFFLFSRSTTHCEPGVVTVKKQPLEVQPFRQHEQKEKGLEDRKR